jgi:hypothetical protein
MKNQKATTSKPTTPQQHATTQPMTDQQRMELLRAELNLLRQQIQEIKQLLDMLKEELAQIKFPGYKSNAQQSLVLHQGKVKIVEDQAFQPSIKEAEA